MALRDGKIQVSANALLDTGALHGNYISEDLAKVLQSKGLIVSKSGAKICSAMGHCEHADKLIECELIYVNQLNHEYEISIYFYNTFP